MNSSSVSLSLSLDSRAEDAAWGAVAAAMAALDAAVAGALAVDAAGAAAEAVAVADAAAATLRFLPLYAILATKPRSFSHFFQAPHLCVPTNDATAVALMGGQ